MIKILRNKFFICLFILVTIFSVTSSCFASTYTEDSITLEDVEAYITKKLGASYLFENGGIYVGGVASDNRFFFYYDATDVSYIKLKYYNTSYIRAYFYNSNDESINVNILKYTLYVSSGASTLNFLTGDGSIYSSTYIDNAFKVSDNTIYSSCTNTIVDTDGTILHYVAPDTSFNYSFEGVKRGQVKLSVTDLNSSLKMYGYVGLNTTFTIDDTLDITANINNLRLMSSMTDNSDLYCYLSEGEELNYYIVDEDNVILDTGYISEMAKGYFLYGFKVNNGVDFVFLKDGQVYWSNDLLFKYSLNDSTILQNNDIVSMGSSCYIVTAKTVPNGTYTGYVYDSGNNLLSKANTVFSNDLSSISISVDTSYFETNVAWNKSCYWLLSFELNGTNVDGSLIDFSDYYVKWSIPTWLVLDSIEVGSQEYTKYNGIFSGFSSSGYSGVVDLKIFELIKEHTSDFDIKLEVFDSNDNLVLTHLINSDDIVANKIKGEENNVDKGNYDIVNNPNYTGGSSGNNFNNIQDWTADDYLNLMSTDNFVWEFFKAILGNLPWWITIPLTILIFGVVIITLIRFARGA